MKGLSKADLIRLQALFSDIGVWSQATFAPDSQRGPIGPLRHLVSEVEEELLGDDCDPYDLEELSDVLILWCDATRRAGFSLEAVLRHGLRHRLNLLSRDIQGKVASVTGAEQEIKQFENLEPRDKFTVCWFNSLLSQYSAILNEAGVTWAELLAVAEKKMIKNKTRVYRKTTGDEISEHDRSKD